MIVVIKLTLSNLKCILRQQVRIFRHYFYEA